MNGNTVRKGQLTYYGRISRKLLRKIDNARNGNVIGGDQKQSGLTTSRHVQWKMIIN